jgi:hypothetical protein
VSPRGSTTAQVSQLNGGTATGIGSVPATFPSADQVRFTVPLSMLERRWADGVQGSVS